MQRNLQKFFRCLTGILAAVSCILFISLALLDNAVPDTFRTYGTGAFQLEAYPGVIADNTADEAVPAQSLTTNKVDGDATIKLAGIVPVKRISVSQIQEIEVHPGGTPFGIKMFTKGVMVVGVSDVYGETGVYNPGAVAGIKKGDIVLSLDGQEVNSNEDVARIVENSSGKSLQTKMMRNDSEFAAEIVPVKDASGKYKIGIWVRDSSAGIGTLTFTVADTNLFAGLGHGVCDVDTGELLPFQRGTIVDVSLTGVVKGRRGTPGELNGYFVPGTLGKLYQNTEMGVYGEFDKEPSIMREMPVALKQDVKRGKATILTTLDEEGPKEYTIEIEKVNYDEQSPTKNMVIRITDPLLLEKTGGIIQGMSGSPIVQDGKLIGAVTHVFVNDPEKGYAIFAENMVKTCLSAKQGNTQ